MNRILYINHYAGSIDHGMEYRPFYLAQEWVKSNNQVLIVAASFSHLRIRNPELRQQFYREKIAAIDYLWCKVPKYQGNGLGRIINILCFIFRLLQKVPYFTFSFRPNLVIASSTYPFDIFPSWIIAKLTQSKLIFEVHDLWPLTPIEIGGMSKWHPFIILTQISEDFAYRYSDKVVSILPHALPYMITRGLNPKKYIHIPNGINLSDWRDFETSAQPSAPLVSKHISIAKCNSRFTLGYLGSHGPANHLELLIDIAQAMKGEKIDFFLIGEGPEKKKLINKVNSFNLCNVHFFDKIPKNAVPQISSEFDFLFISFADSSLYRFGVSPNKLFDYMAAGKPIICVLNTKNNPVIDAKCGINLETRNPEEIALEIKKLMSLNIITRTAMGESGRDYVFENHNLQLLAKKFIETIQNDN